MESNKEYLKFLKTLLKLTENNTDHFDKLKAELEELNGDNT